MPKINAKNIQSFLEKIYISNNLASNNLTLTKSPPITQSELLSLLKKLQLSDISIGPGEIVRTSTEHLDNKEIIEFVNGQKVTLSLDLEKINRLKNLLEQSNPAEKDWQDFFKEPQIAHYAMTLYFLEKIPNYSLLDILNDWQITDGKNFESKEYVNILTPSKKFTKKATKILVNSYLAIEGATFIPLNKTEIEVFLELISSLPKSSCFFFHTDYKKYLEFNAYEAGAIFIHKYFTPPRINVDSEPRLLHLSFAVRNIVDYLRFQKQGRSYKLFKIILGKALPEKMEEEDARAVRLGYVGVPDIPIPDIHQATNSTHWTVMNHDLGHYYVQCATPDIFKKIIDKFITTIRKESGIQNSGEIDLLLDGFIYFLQKFKEINSEKMSAKEVTFHSLKALETSTFNYLFFPVVTYGTPEQKKDGFSVTAILLLLHIHSHPKEWQELKFDLGYVHGPFAGYNAALTMIYEKIKNDDIKIQVMKCMILFHPEIRLIRKNYLEYFTFIDDNKTEILKELKFANYIQGTGTEYNDHNLRLYHRDAIFDPCQFSPQAIKSSWNVITQQLGGQPAEYKESKEEEVEEVELEVQPQKVDVISESAEETALKTKNFP